MKALLLTPNPPLVSAKHPSSSPPNLSSFPFYSTSAQAPPPLTTWKLFANAKGFSGPPASGKSRPAPTGAEANKTGPAGGSVDGQIPEAVLERMMVRILAFVGVPLATGIGLLHVLGSIKESHAWDVPVWVPFMTTLVCFGSSALGLAYGALSSSWDSARSGSVLGLEEARRNWVEIWKEEEGEEGDEW